MTDQERTLLSELLAQLVQVRLGQKDAEAERMIADALARQPDAAYLLVQRTLLQDAALADASARIAQLQRASQASGASGAQSSFLGDPAWGPRAAAARPAPREGAPVVAAASPTGRPVDPAAGARQSSAMGPGPAAAASQQFGGAGSFLGTALSTAAGVAGGAFLFQGLSHMLGQRDTASHAAAPGDASMRDAFDPAPVHRDTDELRQNLRFDDDSTDRANQGDAAYEGDAQFDDAGGFDDGTLDA